MRPPQVEGEVGRFSCDRKRVNVFTATGYMQSCRGTTIVGRMGVPNNIVISGASADRGGSRP